VKSCFPFTRWIGAGLAFDLVPELVEQALVLLERALGGATQRSHLQPGQTSHDRIRAECRDPGRDHPLRRYDHTQGGEELGHVGGEKRVGRRHLGETEIDEPGVARTIHQDVGPSEIAVRDPELPQHPHLSPDRL